MRKNVKVALYSPYLDIFGGGEKHILSILKIFDLYGCEVDLLWNDLEIAGKIKNDLALNFEHLKIVDNFLIKDNFINKLIKTGHYDYVFYVTNGSYFFSLGRNNYIFAMVPKKELFQLSMINKAKLYNWKFICNSQFTQRLLTSFGINSQYIYPYINIDSSVLNNKKDKIILTVGRFFPHLHSKNHKKIIEMFKKFKQKSSLFNDYKLYIIGRCDNKDLPYLRDVEESAKQNDDIVVKVNVSNQELDILYRKAAIYWHFTGLGVNEAENPEKVEHLGMAPLEAMANKCIVFCFCAGGIKEIVRDGINGYIFFNETDLYNKMSNIIINHSIQKELANNASKFIEENFSYKQFEEKVSKVFNL